MHPIHLLISSESEFIHDEGMTIFCFIIAKWCARVTFYRTHHRNAFWFWTQLMVIWTIVSCALVYLLIRKSKVCLIDSVWAKSYPNEQVDWYFQFVNSITDDYDSDLKVFSKAANLYYWLWRFFAVDIAGSLNHWSFLSFWEVIFVGVMNHQSVRIVIHSLSY